MQIMEIMSRTRTNKFKFKPENTNNNPKWNSFKKLILILITKKFNNPSNMKINTKKLMRINRLLHIQIRIKEEVEDKIKMLGTLIIQFNLKPEITNKVSWLINKYRIIKSNGIKNWKTLLIAQIRIASNMNPPYQ